jgi:hypothetical protein
MLKSTIMMIRADLARIVVILCLYPVLSPSVPSPDADPGDLLARRFGTLVAEHSGETDYSRVLQSFQSADRALHLIGGGFQTIADRPFAAHGIMAAAIPSRLPGTILSLQALSARLQI